MKSLRSMCVYAATAAMMMTSMVASAAAPDVRVNIPFDFVASGQKLPAGQYSFANQPTSPVVTLHSVNGVAAMALVNYNPGSMATPSDQKKVNLVFAKKDGTFHLKEIRAGVPRSK
ncbi:hypothetical protein [uncultured Paludibaculum sp.]|uniref:hypothetical protein n=1 Tax=uncultured Paludibaculum sp. TaxID=1765020 RepID=UPI002AABA177|nr:hypothetical protein [uncultured Paludibaculum sp.]